MRCSTIKMSKSGPTVSRFISGYWRLRDWGMGPQQILRFAEECLELGVNTIDHAMVYKSEALFGEALALSPTFREKIQIVTKCGIRPTGYDGPHQEDLGVISTKHYDTSAVHIRSSVDASLTHLKTDYLDVMLIHRPDYLLDCDEVAKCFEDLQTTGKVRYFGVSNFTKEQFELLNHVTKGALVTNQIEFSPYNMQALDSGVFEQCAQHQVSPMLWSCLAAGQLLDPKCEKGERMYRVLNEIKQELEATAIEQVVYAWVLSLPCRPIPLLGTSKIERVKLAVESERYSLSREQWYRIWTASTGHRVP